MKSGSTSHTSLVLCSNWLLYWPRSGRPDSVCRAPLDKVKCIGISKDRAVSNCVGCSRAGAQLSVF